MTIKLTMKKDQQSRTCQMHWRSRKASKSESSRLKEKLVEVSTKAWPPDHWASASLLKALAADL